MLFDYFSYILFTFLQNNVEAILPTTINPREGLSLFICCQFMHVLILYVKNHGDHLLVKHLFSVMLLETGRNFPSQFLYNIDS